MTTNGRHEVIGWRTVVTIAAPLAAVVAFYLGDRNEIITSIDNARFSLRDDIQDLRTQTIARYTDRGRELTDIQRTESVNHANQDGRINAINESLNRMNIEIIRLRDLAGVLVMRVGVLEKHAELGNAGKTAIQSP